MKRTLLFDLSNLAIRTFFTNEVEPTSEHPNYAIWKFMIINSLYTSLFKYDEEDIELICAMDDTSSWRKKVFSRYKESRKKLRDKTEVNWSDLYKHLNSLAKDIKEYLPFKVMKVSFAEADDIIGVLAPFIVKNNDTYVTVISTDSDYKQLLRYKNVQVYDPGKQTFMECEDVENFLTESILTGQKKDDIFNIVTPVDWPEDKRKPGFGPAAAKKTIEYGLKKWLKEKNLEDRYKLNETLIDFRCIPNIISETIKNAYVSYKRPENNMMFKFFQKYKFKSFIEDFTRIVEPKLSKLV